MKFIDITNNYQIKRPIPCSVFFRNPMKNNYIKIYDAPLSYEIAAKIFQGRKKSEKSFDLT